MKKFIYLIVLIVAFGLIVAGCIPVVPPAEQDETSDLMKGSFGTTIYVDDDNPCPGTGSFADPFCTIQAAIDDANPAGGDTIFVAAGTYNERVIINKPLTLQGENRDTTIIDGTGMTAAGIPAYGNNGILIFPGSAYHMSDVDITISGFTVQNFAVIGAGGGAGIAADPTYQYSNITISDVIAKNNGLMGIYVANIVDSQFSNVVVDNNDQIGNGQGYGIHISVFSSSNTFTNIVAKNHDSTGIMVMQANSNTFDNIISSNNKYGIYYCLGSSGNIVTCSTIIDNINNGIKLNAYGTACANNEIHYSNIVGNSNGGVDAANIGTGVTFDAIYNWWGHATGPSHSSNPGGTGDAVSDNVDYDPWSFTPDPCEAKTLGFWKNHEDAVTEIWNLYEPLHLGSYLVAGSSEVIDMLKSAKANNAYKMLAAQLLTAKLNKLHLVHLGFVAACFDAPINLADAFLIDQSYSGPGMSKPSKADKVTAIELKDALDWVNINGCGECVCEWD